jgi:L-lactate dehydrogenase complex protein LldG
MSARTRILDRVRAAQRTGYLPAVADVRIDPAGPKDPRDEEVLARFLAELTALGVEHHVEPTADAVRARVATIVGGAPVLRWDRDHLPYGVGDALASAADGASPREVQAAAVFGVTGCDAAIAETGSLALISGRGKPRAASLLPPTHVALVSPDQLRATMGEFFQERAADIAAAANCTFVTGPSRTADIELTLTLGVHGPGRVVVIVGP